MRISSVLHKGVVMAVKYTDRDMELLRQIRCAKDSGDAELAGKLRRRLDANRNRRERDDVLRSAAPGWSSVVTVAAGRYGSNQHSSPRTMRLSVALYHSH